MRAEVAPEHLGVTRAGRRSSAWTSGTPPVTDAKSASAIAPSEATSSRRSAFVSSSGTRNYSRSGRDVPMTRQVTSAVELEDDLALADEAELLARDPLDGGRVLAELLHLGAELADVAPQLGVLGLDAAELRLERRASAAAPAARAARTGTAMSETVRTASGRPRRQGLGEASRALQR